MSQINEKKRELNKVLVKRAKEIWNCPLNAHELVQGIEDKYKDQIVKLMAEIKELEKEVI